MLLADHGSFDHTLRYSRRGSFRKATRSLLAVALLVCGGTGVQAVEAGRYFRITVVDEQTKRGVPLVELRTVHAVRYFTDSQGMIAFYEPGLMNQEVYFHVSSHGYEFPKDGFGYHGVKTSR